MDRTRSGTRCAFSDANECRRWRQESTRTMLAQFAYATASAQAAM